MSALDLSAVAALLLDAGLKATFILLAALGATRLMRRWPAASRHLVWAVALAAVLALPVLGRVMPEWKALPIPAFLRQAPAPQPLASEPSRPSEAGSGPAAEAPAVSRVESSAASAAAPRAPASGPVPATAAPFDWQLALMILWAAGVALLVLRLGYGLARVAWMERRAVEITDEEWVRAVDRLARRLRVGRMVTLLREAHASVPMTWGVLHPVVLLPAEADGWDAERRTVVLAHELAHVRRWDPLTQWLAHLALAVFWFHPLVWVAARKMREERERACDDAVIALGTRPVSYADHLLDIVRSLGSAEGPAAALAMARRSQFEGRLLAILDSATPRGGVSTAVGLAALAAAAIAVVPLAALRAAEPQVQAAVRRADPSARKPASAPPVREEPAEPVKERSILDRVADGLDAVAGRARDARPGEAPDTPAVRGAPTAVAGPPPAGSAGLQPRQPVLAVALPASEGERAELLVRMAREQEGGDELYLQVIRAAESIGSSSERAAVLLAVLRRPELSNPVLVAALRAAGGIASDGNRRDVLKAVASRRPISEPAVLRAFMDAVAAMASGAERRDVLKTVAARPDQTAAVMQAVVTSSRGIPSSAERRDVLLAVLERPNATEPVLLAVIGATREIPSGAERRDVLRRILARRTLGEAVLVAVFDASCEIPSSAERRDVLVAAAGRRDLTARARAEYLEAARTIPGDSERAAAITALLGDAGRAGSTSEQEGTWNADVGITLDGRSVRIVAKDVVRDGNPLVIRHIRPGGSLVIEETVRGRVRRLEITPGADGGLRRTFRVDREYRTFDSAAQVWMTDILREFTGQ
ncbi:MAG TPA: M56 family metallopeptidase [Longimicrobiaceae bacterium]|nr:M56 family metallopeptidase [Longimicrobiaceae bacterium]